MRYGLPIAIITGALIVFGLWWEENRSLTTSESALFSRLDEATSNSPPDGMDVIAAFDLPADCKPKTCYKRNGQIEGLRYRKADLRQPEEGLILVIDKFSGTCIRTDRVQDYFSAGDPEQSCFDATCWYIRSQREWGILTFEVEAPNSPCVSSAVINSLPEWRN